MLFSPWKIFHCNESHKGKKKKKKNQEPTTLGQAEKCLPWPLFNSRAACLAALRPPPHMWDGAHLRRAHQAQPALYNPTQGRRQELVLGWACVRPKAWGGSKRTKAVALAMEGPPHMQPAGAWLLLLPRPHIELTETNEIQTEPRHLYCP